MKKKFLATLLGFMLLFALMPVQTKAATVGALDLTAVAEDVAGDGWTWDYETKTLSLSGVSVDSTAEGMPAVTLPDGASIVLAEESVNVIAGGAKNAITCEGSLVIAGNGQLTLTGANGIYAKSAVLSNADVAISAASCGIQIYNVDGDAAVTLTNVDGEITGGYAGIYVNGECTESNASVTVDGCDLNVTSTAASYNNRARKSGITVYVSSAEKVESSIIVRNSNLNAVGSDAGLSINNYLGDADATNSASSRINIENSTVRAIGTNGTWSGIFASVLGQHADADSIITIKNSSVYAESPNTGILTSSQRGESKIILDNTILGVSGKTALSMIEPKGQVQVAELKNGSTYVQMTPQAVNKGEITVFDGKVIASVEGQLSYDVEKNYYVIPQNSKVLESYTDGSSREYAFSMQAGGVGGFAYEKEEIWGYDVLVTFDVDPEEAEVAITDAEGNYKEVENNVFVAVADKAYSYKVEAADYVGTTGSFNVSEDTTISVNLDAVLGDGVEPEDPGLDDETGTGDSVLGDGAGPATGDNVMVYVVVLMVVSITAGMIMVSSRKRAK